MRVESTAVPNGGWRLSNVGAQPIWHPSPNFGARRDGARPSLVVLHYTAMRSCDAARDRLCDATAEVSAHYLISESGTIFQLVDEVNRAWHAGVGRWGNIEDVNSHSIGIELSNTGAYPFPEPQIAALETLLAGLLSRHAIAPARVIGHSDMAPLRKSDPGRRFDWQRLARKGLSIWPGNFQDEYLKNSESFETCAQQLGYAETLPQGVMLDAFRQRFRPAATGPFEPTDLVLIADLAVRFPFDASVPAT